MNEKSQDAGNEVGKYGCIGCLSILAFFFIIISISRLTDNTPPPPPPPEHNAEIAYRMSKKFVKDNLKAPSTAVFPDYGDEGVSVQKTGSDKEYYIKAYVDSQNSFGAMIRAKYTCVVMYIGNQSWKLVTV